MTEAFVDTSYKAYRLGNWFHALVHGVATKVGVTVINVTSDRQGTMTFRTDREINGRKMFSITGGQAYGEHYKTAEEK